MKPRKRDIRRTDRPAIGAVSEALESRRMLAVFNGTSGNDTFEITIQAGGAASIVSINGTVNFDDYARTDLGFSTSRTGWTNGDFNYDNVINFDDYALIDLAFNSASLLGARQFSSLGFLSAH